MRRPHKGWGLIALSRLWLAVAGVPPPWSALRTPRLTAPVVPGYNAPSSDTTSLGVAKGPWAPARLLYTRATRRLL